MRRTKILATLGPATDQPGVLEELLLSGANIVRLNFSHGSAQDHNRRAEQVRAIAAKHGLNIAILADLQGPKIRIGRFADGPIELKNGADFCLSTGPEQVGGNEKRVGVDYADLHSDSREGDVLLLDDGRISMAVVEIMGHEIHCKVIEGGVLSNNKGINRQGGGLSAPALSDKDKSDIKVIAEIGFDYVAISFPKNASDIQIAKDLLLEARSYARIVAKIERAEAALNQANLEQIIEVSDAVMVARGDLGVEIGDAELPAVQKQIILSARQQNRLVIVATQMMESMITCSTPTRAEVFDIANAVLDGADAVMLSAETASGDYPVKAVRAMANICLSAEKSPQTRKSNHRVDGCFQRTDEAIAMASMYTANHLEGVKAIVCLTESGNTPLWMSRIRSGIPILALTSHDKTQRRMALVRGVESFIFDPTVFPYGSVNEQALLFLKKNNIIQAEDLLILTKGSRMGLGGLTNAMQIVVA
jgi:pyruvate kinase